MKSLLQVDSRKVPPQRQRQRKIKQFKRRKTERIVQQKKKPLQTF
jgi:hypothetical protein